MELILNVAHSSMEKHHKWVIIATIPVKLVMDDMTIVLKDVKVMQQVISKVNKLLQWTKWKVKPVKSRGITLLRGKDNPKVILTIADKSIPTVCDGPVKSLGRWYDSNLKDMSWVQEVAQCLQNRI